MLPVERRECAARGGGPPLAEGSEELAVQRLDELSAARLRPCGSIVGGEAEGPRVCVLNRA